MTPAEKRKNWWAYHKWHVVIAAVLLLILVPEVVSLIGNWTRQPDYVVCYVGQETIGEETAEQIQDILALYGEDANGDGKVQVELRQHLFIDADNYYNYNAQVIFAALDEECFVYLLDDPARFQEQYGMLAFPDGNIPEVEKSTPEGLWIQWEDCPGLAEMGRSDLAKLCLARRAVSPEEEFGNLQANIAWWENLSGIR